MAWRTIAKKDARSVLDSTLYGYGLGFVALAFVIGGYALPMVQDAPTSADFATYMIDASTLLLPLVGLILGYKAIVGERASGRLGLLLSLPHSRRDVVIGKLVGRGGPLVAAIAAGVLAGSWLVYYPFGSFDPLVVLAYLLLTICYGVAFVGIALAISTLTTSEHLATAGAFGTFFVAVVIWPRLDTVFELALEQVGLADGGLPNWALFVHGLAPNMVYQRVLEGFYASSPGGPYLSDGAAWYLGEWVALGLLLAWTVVPIAFGYLRFQSTDL
jgi:ABC-2 type transport system permease protein